MNRKSLYISYNGLLEPIVPSQVLPYLRNLSRNGYEFVLLTFEKKKDIQKYSTEQLKLIERDLKNHGIAWKRLLYHKSPDKISTFLDLTIGFFSCLYFIAKYKIRIIHVRGVTPGVIALFLSGIFKFKLILDTRGLLAEEYVGGGLWKERGMFFNLVKAVEKILLKKADAIVVLTKKHYEKLIDLPYLKKKNPFVSIIPCCVDMGRFKSNMNNGRGVLKKYNITADKLFIYPGKLGTFYLVKEMMDFFECAASYMKHDLKFLILTQDNERELLNKKIFVDNEKVSFVHPLYEEIPLFLNCADAGIFFINPYKKFGSSPIKLGEFLACGKPVIINSGIGDTEELVMDNRVGVVIKSFNKEEYLDKIGELFKLLQEGEELAIRCRCAAEKFLSLEMGAKLYKNIYNNLIK
jgi:glycosyltransferase involved in cell wall biosynthesis